MSDVFEFRIRTRADLVRAVERYGFVPFFKNRIQGFSLRESVYYICHKNRALTEIVKQHHYPLFRFVGFTNIVTNI